jgi:hypothetical protein
MFDLLLGWTGLPDYAPVSRQLSSSYFATRKHIDINI